MRELGPLFRQACIVTIISGFAGIAFNSLRKAGIPLIAQKPYAIFVPCPEPVTEVDSIPVSTIGQEGTLVIDARSSTAYQKEHPAGALNIPFDYLEPLPDSVIQWILKKQYTRIAVYGDGERPDRGHQMARALAGRGLQSVYYVDGGYPALKGKEGQP